MKNFVLKGHLCYSKSKNELITQENAMLFALTEYPAAILFVAFMEVGFAFYGIDRLLKRKG